MVDPGTAIYFAAVVGGAVILGAAMAYGFSRNRKRTEAERRDTESATHELYEQEERRA